MKIFPTLCFLLIYENIFFNGNFRLLAFKLCIFRYSFASNALCQAPTLNYNNFTPMTEFINIKIPEQQKKMNVRE